MSSRLAGVVSGVASGFSWAFDAMLAGLSGSRLRFLPFWTVPSSRALGSPFPVF
jgi:hypothetical protein